MPGVFSVVPPLSSWYDLGNKERTRLTQEMATVRMTIQYLFNSRGNWIAFREGRYVFDTNGNWIGWLPWNEPEVVDKQGNYLGTIFPDNRLYREVARPYRGYPGYPGYPGSPGYPGYPGFAGHSPLPLGTEDIEALQGA